MFANDGFKIRGRDETGLHVVVEDGTRWRPKPRQVFLIESGCAKHKDYLHVRGLS